MEKAAAAKEKERSLSALMRVKPAAGKLKKAVGKKAPPVGAEEGDGKVRSRANQRLSSPTSSRSGAGVLLLLARSASGSRTGGAVASTTAMEQEAHEDSIEQEGKGENNYETLEEDMRMDEEYSDDVSSEGDPFGLSPGTDEVEQQTEVPGPGPGGDAHCHALLYNLMVLREKVQLLQLHPLVGLAVHGRGGMDPAVAADAGAIVLEIVSASSSMMYAFQHLCGAAGASTTSAAVSNAALQAQDSIVAAAGTAAAAAGCSDHQLQAVEDHEADMQQQQQWQHGGFYDDDDIHGKPAAGGGSATRSAGAGDEHDEDHRLDVAELLAKYTHYCQVCGKGFKRDTNLRMHMRAHGDQFKSKAALANPSSMSSSSPVTAAMAAASNSSKYSCPQEGCQRNMQHARFTPLKSVICAKNHFKRSHCPKMYVCNRCSRKHFSVLSDLRTHEKHCGHRRWLCSCGTTFSRKDKLAGHVSRFAVAGHHPVAAAAGDQRKIDRSSSASSDQLLGNCTNNGGAGGGAGSSIT